MQPVTKTNESGKAGQPGEITASDQIQDQGTKGLKDQGTRGNENILTAAGVAGLLRTELAAMPPGQEESEAPGTEAETIDSGAADQGTEGPKDQGTEGTEQEQAEQEQEQEQEQEGTDQLPEELRAAIEQWESNGKGELPAVLQTLVERRIGKLTGQREQEKSGREAAEAKVLELTSENERLQSQGASPASGPRMDEKTLAQMETVASTFVADAENYLDETATVEERARVEKYMAAEGMDAGALKRRLRETNRWLASELPARRIAAQAFRKQELENEPVARKFFPWLWDKTAPEYGMAQDVLKVMPDLTSRTPSHRMALGIYVLGLKAFEQMQKPEASPKSEVRNPKAERAPVKVVVTGSAAPRAVAVSGKEKQANAARERFRQNPTRQSVTELLRAEL